MLRCWNVNPDFRPSFENLRKRMESYIRDTVCNEGFNNKILEFNLFFRCAVSLSSIIFS